jgi:hypothetical protein
MSYYYLAAPLSRKALLGVAGHDDIAQKTKKAAQRLLEKSPNRKFMH